ncbi:hypothetical protein, partial [Nostoc sp. NOS(2021)]|uniref:hypothetical protein n=1 Tax=Nostoc sp. NOS(2021) TaxID=2815407 RepID=UPI0025D7CC03
NRKSSSLPFIRGGLGWGKTLVNQLFQTCVYTVGLRGEVLGTFARGLIYLLMTSAETCPAVE